MNNIFMFISFISIGISIYLWIKLKKITKTNIDLEQNYAATFNDLIDFKIKNLAYTGRNHDLEIKIIRLQSELEQKYLDLKLKNIELNNLKNKELKNSIASYRKIYNEIQMTPIGSDKFKKLKESINRLAEKIKSLNKDLGHEC